MGGCAPSQPHGMHPSMPTWTELPNPGTEPWFAFPCAAALTEQRPPSMEIPPPWGLSRGRGIAAAPPAPSPAGGAGVGRVQNAGLTGSKGDP